MSYLVAKKYDVPGCIAVKVKRGKALAEIVIELGRTYAGQNIQILTVSSIEAYGEYGPYTVLGSMKEFIYEVKNMVSS